jgi:hypothetical protein
LHRLRTRQRQRKVAARYLPALPHPMNCTSAASSDRPVQYSFPCQARLYRCGERHRRRATQPSDHPPCTDRPGHVHHRGWSGPADAKRRDVGPSRPTSCASQHRNSKHSCCATGDQGRALVAVTSKHRLTIKREPNVEISRNTPSRRAL